MLKFQDRGYRESLLLVPGWGFDARIFQPLDLPYNYVYFTSPDMSLLKSALLELDCEPMPMLGWSQGGVALARFAQCHGERIKRLILVGIRPVYPKTGLDEIRSFLLRSQATYMKRFYKACLDQSQWTWFKQTLQADYLARFDLEDLIFGLDWLAHVCVDTDALKQVPDVVLIHGSADQVAPVAEARTLAQALPEARYVEIPDASHAAFLYPACSGVLV